MYITDLQDEDFEIAIKVTQKTHTFVKNSSTQRVEQRIRTCHIYYFHLGAVCLCEISIRLRCARSSEVSALAHVVFVLLTLIKGWPVYVTSLV
jgi:hypothetical protein